ncbi:DNA sulfur modification protein DndD [Streptomyces chumphonensis]|uniref:Nuclease SbcCD subunit C n=1 Tax=Streptomyces chumphonensis TaxID=1214925 RepID=A0A927EVD7_9ACTN|nr:DNA sulfur modification protein DndD [Streptomyces chumphonensis]MBD3930624.1 DNA sulfur modification protein DndD [Streptomyces chumphonensis]
MLLHKITLHDFGAYQGEQRLDLSTKPGRPIVLIGGLNGCGKTTLLDAIQLVLYGPKAECSGRGSRPYNEYLQQCINRNADPKAGASITLEFSIVVEGVEQHYRVVRNWLFTGEKTLREFLTVLVNGKFSRTVTETWADHVESILPLDVAALFFFDGEKIEELADPRSAARVIESAIHSLLGVSAVKSLGQILKTFENRQQLSGAHQDVLDKIREQEDEYSHAKQVAEDANQMASAARSDLDRCKKELQDSERKFERAGGVEYERRKELEAARNALKSQAQTTNKALVSLSEGALPLLLLQEQLEEVKRQAELEREADDASRVLGVLEQRDKWLLQQITKELPAEARTALRKKLAADRKKRAGVVDLPQNLGLPHDALTQLITLEQVLAGDTNRANELLKDASKLAEDLEIAQRRVDAVPDDEVIGTLVMERQAALEKVAVAEAQVKRAEAIHAEATARHVRLKEDLDRSHKSRREAEWRSEWLKRVIHYSDKTRSTLTKLSDEMLDHHIEVVEAAVLKSFNTLMRKQGLIRDISIDTSKYTLVLTGPDNEPVDPRRLSAGERQLLAVSLLWGLAKAAGNRLPTIIDTPLGRLDSQHRKHLVDRYFPEAGRQVLLLSTDEEIDEQLLKRLKPNIAHTYTLVHDDKTLATSVESGYWWTSGAAYVA